MRLKTLLLAAILMICGLATAQYRFVANSRYVSIYGTKETPSSTELVREMLDEAIDQIQMDTGIYIDEGPEIYLVPDNQSYQRLSLGRERIVEFSDAFYSSREKRIYIKAQLQPSQEYIKILIHEYTHWFLEQVFDGATLWFHEGMAMLYAHQIAPESYIFFTQQRFFGRHSDLFQMSYEYPSNQSQWQIYYLTSLFAVSYLKDKKPGQWRKFWFQTATNHRQGKRTLFIRNFNYSFETSLLDFNAEFRDYSKRLAWQYLILGINSILFAILPFLLILVYHKRKKRMRALPDLPEPVEETEAGEKGGRL